MDKQKIEEAVKLFLEGIGEDPGREGLAETPKRVSNMCEEIFAGINDNPEDYLKFFSSDNNGSPVTVKDIPFYSVCEHHLLPFFGKVNICYVPSDNKVIGLSKLARITDSFAKKPQIQEQLTNQIADFLYNELDAKSVAVFIEAEHMCMTMRGIKAMGSKTQTISVRGGIDIKTALEILK